MRTKYFFEQRTLVPCNIKPQKLCQASEVIFGGSGKYFIDQALKYYKLKGAFDTKVDEILVPQWIGTAVYKQIIENLMPSFRLSRRTKVALVYHQYGYYQKAEAILDLPDNVQIIEDCAHAAAALSIDLLKPVHSRIFSFNKFLSCPGAIGGLQTLDTEFVEIIKKNRKRNNSVKRLIEKDLTRILFDMTQGFKINTKMSYWTNRSYSAYNACSQENPASRLIVQKFLASELEIRSSRLRFFLNDFRNMINPDYWYDHQLPSPYILPVPIGNVIIQNKIIEECAKIGVHVNIINFDVNRNCLKPAFEKCVALPLHSDLPDHLYHNQMDILWKYRHAFS
jgi:hypothetical protein